ncbi:MAG: hypothetical protein L0170_06665 [Acidobacteria bacterium]|nr:hypothetical protein [Acidobacteriota bacterium]
MVRSTEPPASRGLWLLLLIITVLTLRVFELFFRWVMPATQLPLIEYDRTFNILRYRIACAGKGSPPPAGGARGRCAGGSTRAI